MEGVTRAGSQQQQQQQPAPAGTQQLTGLIQPPRPLIQPIPYPVSHRDKTMASYRLITRLGSGLALPSSRHSTNVRAVVPSLRLNNTPSRQATQKAYTEVPKYLQEKMKLFQLPNNLPVHVKGGPTDKILYAITSFVCFIGLIDCCRVYYRLSYPSAKAA